VGERKICHYCGAERDDLVMAATAGYQASSEWITLWRCPDGTECAERHAVKRKET